MFNILSTYRPFQFALTWPYLKAELTKLSFTNHRYCQIYSTVVKRKPKSHDDLVIANLMYSGEGLVPQFEKYMRDAIFCNTNEKTKALCIRLAGLIQRTSSYPRLQGIIPLLIDHLVDVQNQRINFLDSINSSDIPSITNVVFPRLLSLVQLSSLARESISQILRRSDLNPAVLMIQLSRWAEHNQSLYGSVSSDSSSTPRSLSALATIAQVTIFIGT